MEKNCDKKRFSQIFVVSDSLKGDRLVSQNTGIEPPNTETIFKISFSSSVSFFSLL
ncbi:hypothetical protein ES703_43184 [subsurface metagenome]